MKRLLLLGLLVGCVTTQLTPAGRAVRLTSNPEAVSGCRLVGEIEGKDRVNGGMLGQGAAEENATRRLKNKAAEMGANVVLLTTSSAGMGGARMLGEGYLCPTM